MRLKWLFIYLVSITAFVTAQNNLIVLSENGQKFLLFVDDKQINDSAQANVKVRKIYDDTCRIKVVFLDKSISDFSAKVFLIQNGKPISKRDFTYSISDKNGKRQLSFISVNDTHSDTTVKAQSPETKINSIFIALHKQKNEQDKLNEIYPPPSVCIKAISDSLLKINLQLLKDNHTELNRMKDAKWFVSHNCINALQLKMLLSVFDYRLSKVKIAEFSYDYIEDHRNFLQVIDAVEFITEKQELKKFYDKRIEK